MSAPYPPRIRPQVDAVAFLNARNPNSNQNNPLLLGKGPEMRFTALNGGVGAAQLAWLARTLRAAERVGERCLVFAHVLVLPASASGVCGAACVAWNYEEILKVIFNYLIIISISLFIYSIRLFLRV